jgi:hypothetical protein
MANIVFNVALGKANAYVERVASNDPSTSALVVILLKTVEADATLKDRDTLAAILAGGNTEADFVSYTRKVLTDADLTAPAPDDSGNLQESDLPELDYGTVTSGSLVKLLVCYDPVTGSGDDTQIIPLTAHDFVQSVTAAELVISTAAFFRAA